MGFGSLVFHILAFSRIRLILKTPYFHHHISFYHHFLLCLHENLKCSVHKLTSLFLKRFQATAQVLESIFFFTICFMKSSYQSVKNYLMVRGLISLTQILLKLQEEMEIFIGSSYRALKINKPLAFLLISTLAAVVQILNYESFGKV